jgi:hypothetical protein
MTKGSTYLKNTAGQERPARKVLVPSFVNEDQAARVLGLKVKTLRNWRQSGTEDLAYYKLGRAVRYDLDDVVAWAKSRRFTSTTEADARGGDGRGSFNGKPMRQGRQQPPSSQLRSFP